MHFEPHPSNYFIPSLSLVLGISDPGEQRACLDLGKEAGLDIAAITKSVVEQIRNMGVVSARLGVSAPVWCQTPKESVKCYHVSGLIYTQDIPPESHSLELELGNEVELTKVLHTCLWTHCLW